MPELPDVETFRRYAASTALGSTIRDVYVSRDVADAAPRIISPIIGSSFSSVERHGKHLFLICDDRAVRVHFGMTGYFEFHRTERRIDHERAYFDTDRGRLSFVCPRMLGSVGYALPSEFIEHEGLGPDALRIERDRFVDLFSERRGAIKSALMDQHLIAGIGNVYSDEILFQAGFAPDRSDLSVAQLKRVWRIMRRVLRVSIRHHADVSSYPRTYLTRHREDAVACPKCDGTIRREEFQGRGCYVCDTHQT